MITKERKVSLIKPSRSLHGPVKLDGLRLAKNQIEKIETSIFIDANILISMEKVIDKGGKHSLLKDYGLSNFVRFLNSSPNVAISPGLGLTEMPPGKAALSQQKYEMFCSKFLKGFFDASNSIQVQFPASAASEYGFFDVEEEFQALIAISFASFIYLYIADTKSSKDRLKLFNSYLDLLESEVGVLSHVEVEIARYCFSEPKATSRDAINIKAKLRSNFIKYDDKIPKSANDVLKTAFNAACDIRLINAANIIDQNGVDGVRQDCWIATQDAKLALLCEFVYHTNLDGEVGKYGVSELSHDDQDNPYWKLSEEAFLSRLRERELNGRPNFPTDPQSLICVAKKAIKNLEKHFSHEST